MISYQYSSITEGDFNQCTIPENLSNVVAISAGEKHSIALLADGSVEAWGDNSESQINVPDDLIDVVAISAGTYHSLALLYDGTVKAWGRNTNNQCDVSELVDVVAISAGDVHNLVLLSDGSTISIGLDENTADPNFNWSGLSTVMGYGGYTNLDDASMPSLNDVMVYGCDDRPEVNYFKNPMKIDSDAIEIAYIEGEGVKLSWPDFSHYTQSSEYFKIDNDTEVISHYSIYRDETLIDEYIPNIVTSDVMSNEIIIENEKQVYIDNSGFENCRTYIYKIRTHYCNKHEDSQSPSVTINQTIGEVFSSDSIGVTGIKTLEVSKGYYSENIKLTWDNNHNELITKFVIKRRFLNLPGEDLDSEWVFLDYTNNSQHTYVDNYAEANRLYEYKVSGEIICGPITTYYPSNIDVGFRMPESLVSGQVGFSGGTAVKNVKVKVEPSSAQINNSIKLSTNQNLDFSNLFDSTFTDFTFSFWLKESDVAENNEPTLMSSDEIQIYRSNNNLKLSNYVDPPEAFPIDNAALLNWNNITLVFKSQDTLKLYLNGIKVIELDVANYQHISNVVLGGNSTNNFEGYFDELRLFSLPMNDSSVFELFDKHIRREHENLLALYHCDEGSGDSIYDVSKKQNGNFNKNHVSLDDNVTFSDSSPSSNQLSTYDLTDIDGNYMVEAVRYNGSGNNFTITPMTTAPFYITPHDFEPSQRVVFLGDQISTSSDKNFMDISSFKASGFVYYNDLATEDTINSSCPVKDVNIYVDGIPVSYNDELVSTNSEGYFEVDVPIGYHKISVHKEGHDFYNEGKYWDTFQDQKSNISFIDVSTRTIRGRAVGGLLESAITIGFDLSENNIGKAKINFTSQLGGGCSVGSVETDPISGEYEVTLLPEIYTVDFGASPTTYPISSNAEISFGTQDVLDLSDASISKDTLYHPDDALQSVYLHLQRDFIYRTKPIIKVTDIDGNDFIGDKSIILADEAFSLENHYNENNTHAFGSPILKFAKTYSLKISVEEEYVNKDDNTNHVFSKVPVVDENDEIVIINSLSGSPEILSLISDTIDYSFVAGYPEINSPHIKTMTIVVESNGYVESWDAFPDDEGRGNFEGVILGSVPVVGSDFFSAGPQTVNFVLRDPPGDGSYAILEEGFSNETKTIMYSNSENTSNGTGGFLSIGPEWNLTTELNTPFFSLGTGTSINVVAEGGFDLTRETNVASDHIVSTKTTFNQSFQTNADANALTFHGGDLYVGESKNMIFSQTHKIEILSDDEWLDDESNITGSSLTISDVSYKLGNTMGVQVSPANDGTFIYSQDHIINFLIPDLKFVRNNFLQTNEKYTAIFTDVIDEKYGLSNDDPLWNSVEEYPSYTFNPSVTDVGEFRVDSVKWINQQIKLWEDEISDNEKEKIDAVSKYQSSDKRKTFALSSGVTYSSESVTDSISVKSRTIEYHAVNAANWSAGLFAGGVGAQYNGSHSVDITNISFDSKLKDLDFTHCTSVIESYALTSGVLLDGLVLGAIREAMSTCTDPETNSGSFETDTSHTIGYVLNDNTLGDSYLINVYPGAGKNGPIFQIDGGQTACPYYPPTTTQYYTTGVLPLLTYPELDNGTLQREVPNLKIEGSDIEAEQFNVPEAEAAVFTLSLGNESASGDDQYYTLKVLESSNPNGAILKVDGLNPNREFLVPAGTSITKTLTLTKGPDALDYDDILLILHSGCQYDPTDTEQNIADSVFVSAHFLPTCTDISFIQPDPNWVVNTNYVDDSDVTLMNAIINDYNFNYYSLNKINFEYKPSNSSQWNILESYYKTPEENQAGIPTSSSTILYEWDMSDLVDGDYDIRALTNCGEVNGDKVEVYTDVYSGHIDRLRPQSFGNPSPADGILDPNDEIQINFNENINEALLGFPNFSISGILNGSEIRHDASLYFDGADVMTIPSGMNLQNKSFTIEMWINAQSDGVLFTQGYNGGDQMSLSLNEAQRLEFNLSGETAISTSTVDLNKWKHITVLYNKETGQADFLINGDLQNTNDGGVNILADYQGEGPIGVGVGLTGNIHELRVWKGMKNSGDIFAEMLKTQSGREANLFGLWPMDELVGAPQDKARSRHASTSATWQVTPGGMAYSFEASSSEYLSGVMSDLSFRDDQDFTIEVWFKADGSNQTILSNGAVISTPANPEILFGNYNGWTIKTNEDGGIEVISNLITVESIGAFTDNNWHHLALVKNSLSTTNLYIDGTEQASLNSTLFKGFGGTDLVIGATPESNSDATTYTDYLNGSVDELRIWSKARKLNQITRDARAKLVGDESGLVAYYPFEYYTLDDFNQYVTTSTTSDQHSDTFIYTAHDLSGSGSPNELDKPLVRPSRSIEDVNFTYSSNGDQIILSYTDDLKRLEGCILDVEVDGVEDLYGNSMSSPVTWSAYINQNQLIWDDQEINKDKIQGESMSFTTTIINHGGTVESFVLSNFPDWLTATPSEGNLSPNSYEIITFVVNENLFIGDYSQDIILTGNNVYGERLELNINVASEAPNYSFNSSNFEYSMSIIGQIQVGEFISRDENDILFVYINDELRGAANPFYIEQSDRYDLFLDVYSNQESSESLEFRVWDASEGRLYSSVNPNDMSFLSNHLIGSPAEPQLFIATNLLRQEIELQQGWNWISYNLEAQDDSELGQMSIPTATLELESNMVEVFRSQDSFMQYLDGYGWIGSMNTIDLKEMYKVKIDQKDTIVYQGHILDLTDPIYHIEVSEGWNWISYLGLKHISIAEALSSLNPSTNDLIKGKNGFSVYYNDQMGWLGSLSNLSPGNGYMLKSLTEQTLEYPESSLYGSGSFRMDDNQYANDYWNINPNKHEHSMSIIAKIDAGMDRVLAIDNVLGAFNGNECVGNISVTPIESESSLYFLTVYGHQEDELSFSYYDLAKDKIYKAQNRLTFEPDVLIGSIEDPYPIQIDIETQDAEDYFSLSVYPNPFDVVFELEFYLEKTAQVEIHLYDVAGRWVQTIAQASEMNGMQKVLMNGSDISKGLYFIELNIDGKTYQKKIIKN
tara:strand:+ start:2 stop:9028 length:9027 start_codon:yes stop_codon:yes gene_type:complete